MLGTSAAYSAAVFGVSARTIYAIGSRAMQTRTEDAKTIPPRSLGVARRERDEAKELLLLKAPIILRQRPLAKIRFEVINSLSPQAAVPDAPSSSRQRRRRQE